MVRVLIATARGRAEVWPRFSTTSTLMS